MCGRYVRRSPLQQVVELFGAIPESAGLVDAPQYNVAPTQNVLAVRIDAAGKRTVGEFRWGLIPAWADDPAIGNRMINARAETVAEKPAFRAAFKARRCIVPANGFYEWKATGKRKQPYYIHRRDDRLFGIAGLWESWKQGEQKIESCVILTTAANNLMRPIHERMPVILAESEFETWLNPKAKVDGLMGLLRPYSTHDLEAYMVGMGVNNPRNNKAGCMERTEAEI
ncbi:MAG TPA: SOS response-associated peptidase [Tepidisphaeraceae bacterium]|nr:SOS response-associated peptidase [Tepidisphaeraceae bacterium]